ncbi:MAG: 2,3-epoxybenzoyl-CoA dihydrolase [Pseudomonadota bacterium]
MIDHQTDPSRYRHWRIEIDGAVARLIMDVAEDGALFEGYELKLNSYDLGVDIELADAVQRLRFEHPGVRAVVLQSAKERVFCAGANIRMLAAATHAHKVNFCKFTNETRNAMESAAEDSDQHYIAAIRGACAGGGYELALACNHIILADDGTSNVALPEVPLLAVLPGTGGLTRVTDKRKVRRDLADVFCAMEEGARGQRALDWGLVDEIVKNSEFDAVVAARAADIATAASRPTDLEGVRLGPLERTLNEDAIIYSLMEVAIDRGAGTATLTLYGPNSPAPEDMAAFQAEGDQTWLLRLARELDDAILHLRMNEEEIGLWIFRCQGDPLAVMAHEEVIAVERHHWLAEEVRHLWKRVLKRLDVSSRSMIALVEHGSCFAGVLAEILWAVDRSYMMEGEFEGDNRAPANVTLTYGNFQDYPMANGLSRLATRFLDDPDRLERLGGLTGDEQRATEAEAYGLVTFIFDDIDWEDEIRIFLEERASFSPDALTGMEANLRFPGPETMETRIFARLTAWQNWIFQRPNAVGPEGALLRYGTGKRAQFDRSRV